jgi:cytochrome c
VHPLPRDRLQQGRAEIGGRVRQDRRHPPGLPQLHGRLEELGIVWDAETLDRFLADPTAMVPGTFMWAGQVEDVRRQRDVIAFLQRSDRSLDICPR